YAFGEYFSMAKAKDHPDFFYYFINIQNYVGLWLVVVCLPFLVLALMRWRQRSLVLFCWLFVPLMLYSMVLSKWPRYILPIFPALALIVAGEIVIVLRENLYRRHLLCLLMMLCVFQYVAYGVGWLGYTKTLKVASFGYEVGRLSFKPEPNIEVGERLFEILKNEGVALSEEKTVLVLFNIPEIYGTTRLRSSLAGLKYDIVCATEIFTEALPLWPWKGRAEEVLKADYVLVKTGLTPKGFTQAIQDVEDGLRRGFSQYQDRFIKIAEVPATDGARVDVYKKIP
ncbi:MAG: hypothetical protein V2A70_08135, partial [Candidatus Omnitrophota bacterium]